VYGHEAKETGRRVNAHACWTLDDGRAVRMENHTDTAQFARALSA
jgi:ketosteroid isomerase-like protein